MLKKPVFAVPWHPSDQPDILRDRILRRAVRRGAWGDYLATALTAAVAGPAILAAFLAGPPRFPTLRRWPDLVGLGVGPRADLPPAAQADLLDELGIRHVLVRLPVWDAPACVAALDLMARLAPRPVLAVLAQDRHLVCRLDHWRQRLRSLLADLPATVWGVQIGCAANRLKWGCATMGEYLDLAAVASQECRRHPRLHVLGPAAIDFEPLAWLRGTIHLRAEPRFAGLALALYVDRRGSPRARQTGFDLHAKIRLAAALAAAPRAGRALYLTEFNWPLRDCRPWTPTSGTECVDEDTAARHSLDYLRIVQASRLVRRAYFWQLVAPGYGLIDPRCGLRRRPAFAALRRLLAEP